MKTSPDDSPIYGDRLFQIRARSALPLLVRQARAANTISYSDLASELQIPNPRNLNNVLGCIGHSLSRLSNRWKEKIPMIQFVVVNKNTKLPGK